jgi:WD40 repeat protein
MVKKNWFGFKHGITVLVLLIFALLSLGSGASAPQALVYDKSTPVEQQVKLDVGTTLRGVGFDGKRVSWGKFEKLKEISIPAGTHELTMNFRRKTGSSTSTNLWSGSRTTTTYYMTADGLKVTYNFEPGHIYSIDVLEGADGVISLQVVPLILHVNTKAKNGIFTIAYSPDGSKIISGGGDNLIKVWDAESGQEIRTLSGHTGWIYSAAYSPDGKRIVSCDIKTIKVWDAESGQEIRTLSGSSPVYSPDGSRIVSLDNETIKVWDAESGQEIRTLSAESPIYSVAYSPDGTRIASGHYGIILWDAESGKQLQTINSDYMINSIVYSLDGKQILAGGGILDVVSLGECTVYDANSGAVLLVRGTGMRSFAIYSPDNRRIATVSGYNQIIKVWGVEN